MPSPSFSLFLFPLFFCQLHVDDIAISFSRENVINHLASKDHLKNLKHFLWKYGGGMNKVDSFRITEAELAKWEKKLEALKSEAASSGKICEGSSCGQLNDIQPNYEIMNSSDKNSINFVASKVSNAVFPLQYATNENYLVYHSNIQGPGKVGSSNLGLARPMPQGSDTTGGLGLQHPWAMGHTTQHSLISNTTKLSADGFFRVGGYQNLTHISSERMEDKKREMFILGHLLHGLMESDHPSKIGRQLKIEWQPKEY